MHRLHLQTYQSDWHEHQNHILKMVFKWSIQKEMSMNHFFLCGMISIAKTWVYTNELIQMNWRNLIEKQCKLCFLQRSVVHEIWTNTNQLNQSKLQSFNSSKPYGLSNRVMFHLAFKEMNDCCWFRSMFTWFLIFEFSFKCRIHQTTLSNFFHSNSFIMVLHETICFHSLTMICFLLFFIQRLWNTSTQNQTKNELNQRRTGVSKPQKPVLQVESIPKEQRTNETQNKIHNGIKAQVNMLKEMLNNMEQPNKVNQPPRVVSKPPKPVLNVESIPRVEGIENTKQQHEIKSNRLRSRYFKWKMNATRSSVEDRLIRLDRLYGYGFWSHHGLIIQDKNIYLMKKSLWGKWKSVGKAWMFVYRKLIWNWFLFDIFRIVSIQRAFQNCRTIRWDYLSCKLSEFRSFWNPFRSIDLDDLLVDSKKWKEIVSDSSQTRQWIKVRFWSITRIASRPEWYCTCLN